MYNAREMKSLCVAGRKYGFGSEISYETGMFCMIKARRQKVDIRVIGRKISTE